MLCVIGWFMFSVLDAFTKHFTETYSVIHLLAMSSTMGTALSAGWIFYRYGWAGFKTKNWKLFILRGVIIIFGAFSTLKALSMITLADFYGIVFMSPFLVTIMSVLILKEKIGIHRITALIVGFIGVLILAGPQMNSSPEGLFWVFIATFLGSSSTILIRKIGREKVTAIFAFVPAFSTMIIYVPLALVMHEKLHIPAPAWELAYPFLLGTLGFFGFMAYSFGLTRATETALISPFHYTQMVWGVLFGYMFFGDLPTPTTIIGSAVILAAGLYILWREYVLHKVNHSVSATVTASGTVSLPDS